MGFITLGIETATGVEPGRRKTSVGVRVYFWLCVAAIVVFLPVEYFAATLQFPPGQFPPALALWLYGPTAILTGGSLGVGFWTLKKDSAPRVTQIMGKTAAAFVAAIFTLSVIGCVQALAALAR